MRAVVRKPLWFVGPIALCALAGFGHRCPATAGTVAEVKPYNGAPTMFINGKPQTGLMFWTTDPVSKAAVRGGRLELGASVGTVQAQMKPVGDGRLAVEITAAMQAATMDDGTLALVARQDDQNAYYLGLGAYGDGNQIKLWKSSANGWQCWFTTKWDWKLGQPCRLRLVVDGSRVQGYVDDKLVGEKQDDYPLKPTRIALEAYWCSGWFDDLSITAPGGPVLQRDSFAAPDSAKWEPLSSGFGRIREFADAGIHLYSFDLGLGACWHGPGSYDYKTIDAALAAVVAADPKALILPRVDVNAPAWWRAQYPQELGKAWCRDGKDGNMVDVGWRQCFSSRRWLEDAGAALQDYVRHLEASPCADHVLGYHICSGDCGEWSYGWGADGVSDYGLPQVAGFQQWLRRRYGDPARLRQAWKQGGVDFDTAGIPSGQRRCAGDLFEFFDPAQGTQVPDYLEYHNQVISDAILAFARIVKEASGRRKLCGVFDGYYFFGTGPLLLSAGHRDLARVLDSPDVDFIASPHNYRERQAGGVCVPQAVSGSIRLHGKLYYDEDDTRTSLAPGNANFGRATTIDESIEVLKRNWACDMTAGGTLWWMEQSGGWFSHPRILAAFQRMQQVSGQLARRDRRSNAEIAVIVSDQSTRYLRHSGSLVEPLVNDEMVEQMPRIGAPFDIYLADDLARLPDYKLYIFLNTPFLTDEQRRVIKERILRGGHTALWVYAPGFVTPRGLSVDAMSDLTGLRLRTDETGGRPRLALTDLDHEITRGLPPGLLFSTQEPIGPLFWCDDPAARVLGELYAMPGLNRDWNWQQGMLIKPGLAVKQLPGWRSVWCGVPDIPACLLRGIARTAGVHIYSDQDDVVYADRAILAIHARHAGQRTIHLPTPATVVDTFTGQTVARGATEFKVPLRKGETGCWLLE